MANGHELRMLVTGKTGQGKSTLVNGILGAHTVQLAKEGARANRRTTKVKKYTKTINNVLVTVFDSPGLQDRTENEKDYIENMREQCKELSLILYCTKMINTRLTDDDKHAMKKLTEAFGEKFWNYAVFVLTFANMENCERRDSRDDDLEEPDFDDEEGWKALIKERFEGRLKIWEEELKQFLINDVGVNQKIAEEIPVIPTGDYKITRENRMPLCLPDRDSWFNKFWEACCLRVEETGLFLRINKDRMIVDETKDDEETQDLDNKDITVAKLPTRKRGPYTSGIDKPALGLEEDTSMSTVREQLRPPPPKQRKITEEELSETSVHPANYNIHISPEFAKKVIEKSILRCCGEAIADATKATLNLIAKPGSWLIRLLTKT